MGTYRITTSQVASLLASHGNMPEWLAARHAAEHYPHGAQMTVTPDTHSVAGGVFTVTGGTVTVTAAPPTGTCPKTGHSAHSPQACPDKSFPRGSHATVSPCAPQSAAAYRGRTGHVCGLPYVSRHSGNAVTYVPVAFAEGHGGYAVAHMPAAYLARAPRGACPDAG